MAHLISISENVSPSQPIGIGNRGQVFATAEASFDRDLSCLRVKLGSFTWRPGFEGEGDQPPLDWLPQPVTITESISGEEATQITKEIFNNWLREVQRRIALSAEKNEVEEAASPRIDSATREHEPES